MAVRTKQKAVRVDLHPPKAKPGQGADTRGAILAAAGAAFATAGLAGARTDAIAAAAGVNKALLYYYFDSKELLFEAVVEDHFKAFSARALRVLNQPGSARAALLDYVNLHFDFMTERRPYACLYQQMMMAGGKPLRRLVRKYFAPRADALAALLDRGMKAGELRPADRQHAAISITALIVFYFSAAQVLPLLGHTDAYSAANLALRKGEVLDFIRFGLFRDPEKP